VDNTERVTGVSVASTESLNPGEIGFFKLLDKNIAIIEKDTKAEANIIHGFNSHRSTIIL
jgi:hypothetical protein